MTEPFFVFWLSILAGIVGAVWPTSVWLWLSVGILLIVFRTLRRAIFIGFLLGLLRAAFHLHQMTPMIDLDQNPHTFSVWVHQANEFGVQASVEKIDGEWLSQTAFVRLSGKFNLGEKLQGVGRLLPLQTYEPVLRLPKERIRYEQKLLGRLKWDRPPESLGLDLKLKDRIREKIFSRLKTPFEPLGGLRRALTFGDGSGISPNIWAAMNYLSLSHALVISGLHLSFLIMIFSFFSKRFFRFLKIKKYILYKAFLLFLVGSFSFLCNDDISLARAVLGFLFLSVVAYFFPKLHRYSSAEKVSIVGIIIALWSPLALFSPNYLLSFGATFAIIKSLEWGSKNIIFYPYFLFVPLCTMFGFFVHPLSPLFNLILLPPFFILIVPAALVSVFVPSLEALANEFAKYYFEVIEGLFRFLSNHAPISHFRPVWAAGLLICILGVFINRSLSLKKRFLLLSLFAVGFQVLSFLPIDLNYSKHSTIEVTALDIGQGDGFLIKMENLKIMIDGGGPFEGAHQLLPAVLNETENNIDLWVLTHFDRDHIGNFREIKNQVNPKEIWIPRSDDGSFSKDLPVNITKKVADGDLEICSQHYCLRAWMDPLRKLKKSRVENDDCIVILLVSRESNTLLAVFLGDLFSGGEKKLILYLKNAGYSASTPLDLLKAGHHGSKTSSSEDLIEYLRPKIVILSSGRHNAYHHPHLAVVDRLERWGGTVLRTDVLGNFKLYFDF
ncbi:MAG: internalization-related competence protein ComEC/Rec2 [Bacteriovoracaceae bacterium]|nr:internalization-related competence protein ComEC/Rec2 [Bacteriovoracaceae bacterium]